MNLNLNKPICFFDLETTGTNIVKDRIVEISIIKVHTDQQTEELTMRINPTIAIPKESSAIHGIFDEDVKDSPTFAEKAQDIYEFFGDSDLGGFNSNRFDVPLIVEEFLRVDVLFDISNRKLVDVQRIFHLMEKRTLEAAYQFYCGKDLTDAHSASADTRATYEVLLAQIDKYENLQNDVDSLHNISNDDELIDTARRLVKISGKAAFNFGKYKGQYVADVLQKDPGYYNWILNSEFPLHTKQKLKEIKLSLNF